MAGIKNLGGANDAPPFLFSAHFLSAVQDNCLLACHREDFPLSFSCGYFSIFAGYRQAVAFAYIDRYKKDFGRLVKVLCFCILLSIFDFKPLWLPIRFQKWSPSGF